MKKLFALTLAIGFAGIAQAVTTNHWNATLTTTSTTVFPALKGYTAIEATNGVTYSAGDYVEINGRDYWTPNGGTYTTANAPSHKRGIEDSGDGILWYYIPSSVSSVTIQILESGDVWFVEGGSVPIANNARLLTGKGMAWEFLYNPGEINALAAATTKKISIVVR